MSISPTPGTGSPGVALTEQSLGQLRESPQPYNPQMAGGDPETHPEELVGEQIVAFPLGLLQRVLTLQLHKLHECAEGQLLGGGVAKGPRCTPTTRYPLQTGA